MNGVSSCVRWARWLAVAAVSLLAGFVVYRALGGAPPAKSPAAPVPESRGPASRPGVRPNMGAPSLSIDSKDMGPDTVTLKELVDVYDPVPFNHKTHAMMAEMWDGCVTCHHRSPEPATRPATQPSMNGRGAVTQADSTQIPACKSCHPVDNKDVDVQMPGLKGAYHRQCLNCHREWTHANACNACHAPRKPGAEAVAHTPDDITGRMHPPIPEPDEKLYKTRFTPADGGNVLFRHKEHVKSFGLKCAHCHRGDTCSNCHDADAKSIRVKPVTPGKTWAESHGPCMSCHEQDRCRHCHYKDDQPPPPVFAHAMTGQLLDKDHENLACLQCHSRMKDRPDPTCGGVECHQENPAIAFPAQRPGPRASTRPASATSATFRPIRGTAR